MPPLAPHTFICFSNHQAGMCLNAPWRRQFLLRIWPTQLTFIRRILLRSVFFSPMHFRTSLVTFSDHLFSSSTTSDFETLKSWLIQFNSLVKYSMKECSESFSNKFTNMKNMDEIYFFSISIKSHQFILFRIRSV